jgi:hypothetical protein
MMKSDIPDGESDAPLQSTRAYDCAQLRTILYTKQRVAMHWEEIYSLVVDHPAQT